MFTRKLSFTKPTYPKARAMGITKFPYVEYDSNGKPTYVEYSNGFWDRYEYDSRGNKTYHENSKGFWIKKEFDSNNKGIYYEDGYKETFAQGK